MRNNSAVAMPPVLGRCAHANLSPITKRFQSSGLDSRTGLHRFQPARAPLECPSIDRAERRQVLLDRPDRWYLRVKTAPQLALGDGLAKGLGERVRAAHRELQPID